MTYEFVPRCWFPSFVVNRLLVLTSKNVSAILDLTLFLEPGGQKSGCLALDGFHSAGNLELQLVEKIESLTSRKIKDEWFLQLLIFYEASFASRGIEDGVIFWRTPVDKCCLWQADNLQQNTKNAPLLEVEMHKFTLHMMQRYSSWDVFGLKLLLHSESVPFL